MKGLVKIINLYHVLNVKFTVHVLFKHNLNPSTPLLGYQISYFGGMVRVLQFHLQCISKRRDSTTCMC